MIRHWNIQDWAREQEKQAAYWAAVCEANRTKWWELLPLLLWVPVILAGGKLLGC